jgi:hypothetical protein
MRTRLWLAAVAAALAGAGSASAQQALTWGPVNGPLIFQVVNTDRNQLPISGPMLAPTKFSLTSIFGNVGNITNQHVWGGSNFPTPAQMPGKAYLSNFGIQRAPRAQ